MQATRVICVSVLSAVLFSLATALKHSSAGRVPQVTSVHPGDLVRFAGATLRHPRWLLGVLADVAGLALQVLALRLGGVIVVQVVLTTTVLFSLVFSQWLAGCAINRSEVLLGAILVAAIAGFLVVSGAATASADEPDRLPAVLCAATVLAAVTTLVVVARRHRHARPSGRPAALLGAAVGATFAGTAALLKACTTIAARQGPALLLASWQTYAVVVTGALGLLLTQLAFQAGPLSASLPFIATVNPLVAVALGVIVFDEQLRTDLMPVTLAVLCLAVLAVAAIRLSATRAAVTPA